MQNNNPLISIITICFNLENQISKSIESVLKLDYSNIEFIVIDGNSKDNTLSIIKSYEPKFKEKEITFSYYSEDDEGIYDAMNKGVDKANGQWVTILTGGDEYHPDFSLKEMFKNSINDRIYFGKSISYYRDFRKIRYRNFHLERKQWYFNYMPNHQAVFVPYKFYKNNKYNLELNFSADSLYLRKAFDNLDYYYSDQIVSLFELGGVSNYYGSYNNLKKIIFDATILETTWNRKLVSIMKHCIKYVTQRILGRDRYLEFYIKKILKED